MSDFGKISNQFGGGIGEGIIEKEKNWLQCIGKGYVWVMDGCENAEMQDWLREQGEWVVGTNKAMSDMENDRKKGQDLFKKAGFNQPTSITFEGESAFDEAIDFIKEHTS